MRAYRNISSSESVSSQECVANGESNVACVVLVGHEGEFGAGIICLSRGIVLMEILFEEGGKGVF